MEMAHLPMTQFWSPDSCTATYMNLGSKTVSWADVPFLYSCTATSVTYIWHTCEKVNKMEFTAKNGIDQ